MLYSIVCKLKHILLAIGGIFSKIFCCFRRRRRNSDSIIPVNVTKTASNFINEVAGGTNWDDDDWDNCEIVIDKHQPQPRTTSDHIAMYRQQVAVRQTSAQEEEKAEPEVDYFTDMIPEIRRQRKVFVGKEKADGGPSRLSVVEVAAPAPVSGGTELANWEDGDTQGWDCQEDDLTDALRSHRRSRR